MSQKEAKFKIVKWVLGAYNAAVTRLRRSLTPEFIGTPSDNAADKQGGAGGVPAGRVAWPVGTASHDGASFLGCDAFPAQYVHSTDPKERKVYLLDSLGKRHYGASPLIVGENVELAGGVEADSDGVVVRGAEFGDARKVVGGPILANNIFYPAGMKLIAHHLDPDPPKQSTQVYDVDGRKGGLHWPLRVREWLVRFGTGTLGHKAAPGFLPRIFAPLFNFTLNGDGTPAMGAAHFGRSEAVLSAEAGGPLRPADDGNHELGETSEAKINQGANDIEVLYGPIRDLYGPEEWIDAQWQNGGKGPFVKRVEKRPDFPAKHLNALRVPVPLVIKWQTWSDWNTYPTIPPGTPPDIPPVPPDSPPPGPPTAPPGTPIPPPNIIPAAATIPRPDPRIPGYAGGPPTTSTPNETGVPSEYGEPVPGTPEPRVPVPDEGSDTPRGTSRQVLSGHNFTEAEWQKQGRVGHSVYAPVYKSNTAGAGSTAAQRWPVSYTSEGKLYVAANGQVLAVERPYYASGARITLAPEMGREMQFVANKETWPTNLSAFYTIFGAGKNVAGVEFIGGMGIGLRVPNMYVPASGWYFKLDYTDSTTLPDIDLRSTDENGLDASTGRVLKINGTTILGTGDVVGPAGATDNAVALFDSTTGKLIKNSTLTFASNVLENSAASTLTVRAAAGQGTAIGRAANQSSVLGTTVNIGDLLAASAVQLSVVAGSTFAGPPQTTTLAGGGLVEALEDDGTNGERTYIEEVQTTDATITAIIDIPRVAGATMALEYTVTAVAAADSTKRFVQREVKEYYDNAGTLTAGTAVEGPNIANSLAAGGTVTATTSGTNIRVTVRGAAATNINWGIVARVSWRNTTT